MNNAEKVLVGRQLAEKYWRELRETFGDDDYRIRMVINDLQTRHIKLHVQLTAPLDQAAREWSE